MWSTFCKTLLIGFILQNDSHIWFSDQANIPEQTLEPKFVWWLYFEIKLSKFFYENAWIYERDKIITYVS